MYWKIIFTCTSHKKVAFLFSGEKKADLSRPQGLCHIIHIFFGSSLGKAQLCQVPSLWNVHDRF